MKLEIIKEIDTKEKSWCDSAALVYVKGGNSRLTTVTSKELWDNDDNYSLFHVMLNGKPIVQSNIPFCPTCSGMLARGYGIENIDTPELNEIRDKINAPFVDLKKSIEDIKPILGLLEDGYYIIADAMLYPTDGEDRFFMNVPDKLTYNEAVTQDYYNHDYITVSECFPAYLYPTQSNKYLNITRSREYCDIIDKDNAPRAIAYYHYGFMCALLDGHHKAYAAAMKGVRLHSLIIIPCQNVLTKNYGDTERYGVFADIIISMKELPNYKADNRANDSLSIINFPDNNIIPETDLILECYPNIDELTGFILSELEEVDLTEELVDKWLIRNSDEDQSKLKDSLGYFGKTDIKKAMMIAKRILKSDNSAYYLKETAMRFIVRHKSDESEQLAIDYIIDHEPDDPIYKIADGYWC